MSTIKLISLHCDKLQDSISEDEIEVHVGGTRVLGPIGVHKGGDVSLGGATRTFTGSSVSVQLFEIDKNSKADDLGTEFAHDKDTGTPVLVFDKASKALYRVTYQVT